MAKIFNCNVHSFIKVSQLAINIIDTKEFQRLRHIKQLGITSFVYPSATHTRFEHSLGVYHLTEKVLDRLLCLYPNRNYNTKELGIVKLEDDIVKECIKIAGLCHDIGHGPYSHLFDDIILKKLNLNLPDHEERSKIIVSNICHKYTDLNNDYINFICALISPDLNIPEHNNALYQIVCNKLNDIDVDKFDYLVRDSKNTGINISFDYRRLINEFILDSNDKIIFPEHCAIDIYEMFHSRYIMHKKIYQHKTSKIIELLVCDIIVEINDTYGIIEKITMDNFCDFNDYFIYAHPTSLINKLYTRKLYKLVYYSDKPPEPNILHNYNLIVVSYGYISSNKNPFNFVYFYNKRNMTDSHLLDSNNISIMIQNNHIETKYLVIDKS
jgi:HD superfamily phosphohydrolase